AMSPPCGLPISEPDGRSTAPARQDRDSRPRLKKPSARPARRKDPPMLTRLPYASLRRVLALGVLLGSMAGNPARAADAAASQSAFADTSKPVTFLKETVVTGARFPRRFFESPQGVSYLSHTQLSELAPAVISDAFQQLPGVDNSKDSPWEQRPVLRGL